MSFLAPALLFGLLLAAAPIIIHLLNRRRFIRVDWAPMTYLKLTLKTNRRRLRLEQWILLALRTLAVAALIVAVARPVGSGLNLAGLLRVEGRASRVLVLDDSLGMALKSGGRSAFQRARETLVRILHEIGPQDGLTVLTTSAPRTPLIRDVQLDEEQLSRVNAVLEALAVTDAGSSWRATFDAVDAHLASTAFPVKEVILLTDLCAAGWTAEAAEVADRWADQGVTLRIFDVGRPSTGNRVLADLVRVEPVVLVDTPAKFLARIRNDGGEPLEHQSAVLSIDDLEQPVELPPIADGETVEVPLTLTFNQPGPHRVSLRIPADNLEPDDRRFLAVDVRREVHVVLVDGDPGLHPFEGEVDFVAVAVTAGNAPWRATQTVSTDWAHQPLEAPDVLVLANVDAIAADRVQALEQLVAAGMGLMIFPGDQMSADAWNDRVYRDGRGLLPARIEGPRDVEVKGLLMEPVTDSPLAALGKLTPSALARIRPRRLLQVSLPSDAGEQVRVLARWDDAEQSPALVEKRFGNGRVLLWTITADRAWSDWPVENSFVLAMRVAAQGVASQIIRGEKLVAGEPLMWLFDVETPPLTADVLPPGVEHAASVAIDRKPEEPAQLRYGDTARAGFYEASWSDERRQTRRAQFALNPDVRDSDLSRLTGEQLQSCLGRLRPRVFKVEGDALEIAAAGAELWRPFVFLLLGMLVAESGLAAWIDRAR